jgi:hypothetical protein
VYGAEKVATMEGSDLAEGWMRCLERESPREAGFRRGLVLIGRSSRL